MKNTAQSKPSYVGKSIYVGIDVHKRTYTVVARMEHQEVKRWTTLADPEALGKQLQKYFSGGTIYTAYESGFSGFVLHRELARIGIKSRVIHAASLEVASNNRVKTDKRDARRIAEQLEAGRLRAIRIPSDAEEHRRLLSRTRAQLIRERTRVQNQIRMKAHQFGLIAAADRRQMSHKLVREMLSVNQSREFELVVNAHQSVWRTLEQEIKELENQLKEQAAKDPYEATYRSVPGIGFISARILSNELGDLSQFANERQLFSYTGLTPSEASSGDSVRRGRISKQGNVYVRSILIEVAWRAIGQDPTLSAFYERVKRRSGGKRAIVAVARKLIGRIRAAFRQQTHYCIESQCIESQASVAA